MDILLVRHAEAVDLGTEGAATDAARHLTVRGHGQAAGLATALFRIGPPVTHVFTSPLVRARQTAEHLARRLTPGHDASLDDRLALGELRPKRVAKWLDELDPPAGVVALVGHMPDVSEFLGWMIGTPAEAIDFKKAAAARVSFPGAVRQGEGILRWFVPPAWFAD